MIGVEIDIIVSDSIKAFELYEKIFGAEKIEATAFEKGLNESVFTIYGTRFHLLDENMEYGMAAAKPEDPKSIWFNLVVPDIKETFQKAIDAGCKEIQPITEMEAMGVINAMFIDPYGIVWMLHQIVREVSFEERIKVMEKMMENK
ncbi:MAG: VOC family protein [Methanosarcinales archaeon]|jgi:PhnB protein|nr:VOC family protein [Methanosarcinales archaeon]